MSGFTSLCRNSDFQRLYRRGKSAVRSTMVMYAVCGKPKGLRLGITAGKKVGCAVERNRGKRRIRELFRTYAPEFKNGCDVVIVARARIVNAKAEKVKGDFLSAAKELGLFASGCDKDK